MSKFDSKSLLAKLMATENLYVEQANVPTASFDVLNRILTVPILDSNLSGDLYDLFIGHEVGHALYTPVDEMKEAKDSGVHMSILNVCEDYRIERKIKYKYPGLKNCFVKAYKELMEKDFFETKEKDLQLMNFIDRMNLHHKVGPILGIKFTDFERELISEVESAEKYSEVVEVAKKIHEYMKDELENLAQKLGVSMKEAAEMVLSSQEKEWDKSTLKNLFTKYLEDEGDEILEKIKVIVRRID